jgi:hypothetical protein
MKGRDHLEGFDARMIIKMTRAVFWVACIIWAIALMMQAARTSETSVNVYQTKRRYNPEDSRLHTRRRENQKSYKIKMISYIRSVSCGLQ